MNFRKAIAVVLLLLIAQGILPFAYQEVPDLSGGGPGAVSCRIEPLQVCDPGDPFFGSLAGFPVLVPGTPVLILCPEIRFFAPDFASFVPDGFHPAIDHPPQLSA